MIPNKRMTVIPALTTVIYIWPTISTTNYVGNFFKAYTASASLRRIEGYGQLKLDFSSTNRQSEDSFSLLIL